MSKYIYAGISLQNARLTNMDSLLLKLGRIENNDVILAVVCDGVGSLTDGGVASAMAVRMLSAWLEGVHTAERVGIKMKDCILEINSHIVNTSKCETASTLTALLLMQGYYYIVHLGDSRAYCLENGKLICITKDDVSEEGKLTAYIGRNRQIFPQYYEGCAKGKTFLLCTDGLHNRMDNNYILRQLNTGTQKEMEKSIKKLPQFVIDLGEKDNISLAVVKGVFAKW